MGFIVCGTMVIVGVLLLFSHNSVFSDDSFVMTIKNNDNSIPTLIDFEFYLTESESNKQIQGVVGWIFLGTENYLMEQLHGGFAPNDDSFVFSGIARNSENKSVRFFISGINDSMQNKTYNTYISLISDDYIHFNTEGKIVSSATSTSLNMAENHIQKIETQKLKQEQQQLESYNIHIETKKQQISKRSNSSENHILNILALIKDSPRREKTEDYVFSLKLYDEFYNSYGEESIKGGELSDSKVNIMIFDSQGYVLREISELTNEFGRLNGIIPLGDDFSVGTYTVEYKIQTESRTQVIQKPLFVISPRVDENYRHFVPVADYADGFWNDNSGNANGDLFDDLDEISSTHIVGDKDDDYIHSRNINLNQQSDTFQVKMDTHEEVTESHPHQIFYRLGKEPGGNTLTFIVKLYENNRVVAQWTYNNVPADLTTYSEIVPPDQAASITNYHSLSLEFTVQCDTCISPNSNQRQGYVSWVHMII